MAECALAHVRGDFFARNDECLGAFSGTDVFGCRAGRLCLQAAALLLSYSSQVLTKTRLRRLTTAFRRLRCGAIQLDSWRAPRLVFLMELRSSLMAPRSTRLDQLRICIILLSRAPTRRTLSRLRHHAPGNFVYALLLRSRYPLRTMNARHPAIGQTRINTTTVGCATTHRITATSSPCHVPPGLCPKNVYVSE